MSITDIVKAKEAENKGEPNTALVWICRASIKSPVGHHIDKVEIIDESLIDIVMELKDYGEENIVEANFGKG
ncbi:MAG: hypothetical protein Q8O01_01155 [Candidatus Omnitrophota bacterium]|nr:hypothetical protein [Candidatus Omnitrophota bacterium]